MTSEQRADEPADRTTVGGLVRLRLDLSYDGTAYAGWARQPGLSTVQGTLEQALATVLRVPVTLVVAGRTDAGVHALGQVAHTDIPAGRWPTAGAAASRLLPRLAGLLPGDVRVRGLQPAPAGFDARRSALSRVYRYRVTDAPWGADPLRRHDTLVVRRPLDVARLRDASATLLGEHDFVAYCRAREGATTVRRLLRLDWDRQPDDATADAAADAAADVVTATVEADAFCHSMVRSLVGALLAVGDGRRTVGWPADLLTARSRRGLPVAPPHGLALLTVRYPPDAELAAQAALTRRRRGPRLDPPWGPPPR